MDSTQGLRGRILAGEPLVGAFSDSGSAVAAEVLAHAGFDWLVLDLEHGALGPAPLVHQLQAVSASATAPLVRVPGPRSELVGWVLDAGAAGVMVPRVETVDDVRAVEAATRYAASRGAAPAVRAARFGRDPAYARTADAERVLLVQVETAAALEAVDAIAALEGVDVLFLGPADLARSLGLAGAGAAHPRILEAAERIAAAARAHGRAAGVYTDDPAHAPLYRERGFTVIGSGFDVSLLRDAADRRLSDLRRLTA